MQDPLNSRLLSPGTLLGSSYEIKSVISQHPGATVYLAHHNLLSKDVALKVLNFYDADLDSKNLLRFRQEVKLASSLDHPNIVKTLASGSLDDGRPYLVMELVEGTTLAEHLSKNGALNIDSFKEIFCQILSGLAYVHSRGLLHRDIKPENILIARADDGFRIAKLSDFGIAKVIDDVEGQQSLTSTRDLLGSPAYMSPEQCKKENLDERSDIYSLACVMYESLAGKTPFVAETVLDLMYKQLHDNAEQLSKVNSKIPVNLSSLVQRCLAKDRKDRWQNAPELKTALDQLQFENTGGFKKLPALLFLLLVTGLASYFVSQHQSPARSFLLSLLPNNSTQSTSTHPGAGQNHTAIARKQKQLPATFEGFQEGYRRSDFAGMRDVLDRLSKAKDLSDQAHLHACYVLYYFTLSNYSEALSHAQKSAALSVKQGFAKDEFEYEHRRLEEAECFMKLKDYRAADAILSELEEKYERQGHPRPLYGVISSRCNYLFGSGNYKKLTDFCKQNIRKIDFEKSIQHEQVDKFRLLAELMLSCAARNDLGGLQSVYGAAESELNKLQLPPSDRATLMQSLAQPYLLLADGKSALRVLEESSRLWQSNSKQLDSVERIRVQQELAAAKLLNAEFDAAKAGFYKVMEIQDKLGYRQTLPNYLGLAYIAYKSADNRLAHCFVRIALALDGREWGWCDPATQSVDVYLFLADRLIAEGDMKAAARLLDQSDSLPVHNAEQKKRAAELRLKIGK